MAASYPSALKTFTTIVDLSDSALASHQNDRGDEITAIETELGTLPKGGYASVKARFEGLKTGWQNVTDTWTYASSTTVTVPTDATATYEVGYAVRLKQGGGYKYYYITGVTATVLTLNGGSDYTVANSAITDIYISPDSSPVDFPGYFNFSTTRAVSGGTVPTYTAADFNIFWMVGGMVHGHLSWNNTAGGTAGAGTNALTFTLPVTANALTYQVGRTVLGAAQVYESAGTIGAAYVAYNTTTTAKFQLNTSVANIVGNDQSSTDRFISATYCYKAA